MPMTRASVPLRMANVRGAPPMRIGWVNATWSGTSKPSISSGRAMVHSPSTEQAKPHLPPSAAVEAEERHAEAGGRHRDGHAQQQAEDAPQPAAFAECEAEPNDHDGQDAQRLGHRPGKAGQHLVQWA